MEKIKKLVLIEAFESCQSLKIGKKVAFDQNCSLVVGDQIFSITEIINFEKKGFPTIF